MRAHTGETRGNALRGNHSRVRIAITRSRHVTPTGTSDRNEVPERKEGRAAPRLRSRDKRVTSRAPHGHAIAVR
jgi:hypothetical protein